MKATTSIKGLMVLVLGLAVLTTAGCMGGDKNFTSSAAAAPAGQTAGVAHANVGTRIGDQAPDFTLKTLDGNTIHLSDFRGKPVFVNFWASWCPPCKAEIPDIEKFYEKYKGKVTVLGVNLTFNDKMSDIVNLLQADHATYPVLLDEDNSHPVTDTYHVDGIPASFFVDKNGVIRDVYVGEMDLQMMEDSISKAMQ